MSHPLDLQRCGVGNGTTIDHIEIANKFFGGSVNAKYLTVAYVGDEHRRRRSLVPSSHRMKTPIVHLSGTVPLSRTTRQTPPHYSAPVILQSVSGEDNNIGLEIRDNAGGQVWNSIFTEFAKSIMDVEATSSSKGTQSDTNSSLYGSQALDANGARLQG